MKVLLVIVVSFVVVIAIGIALNPEPPSEDLCEGIEMCEEGKLERVGVINSVRVKGVGYFHLAMFDAPLSNEGIANMIDYWEEYCPIGSPVGVQIDEQYQVNYEMFGVVHCNDKVMNAELILAGHGSLDRWFCTNSSFSETDWAKDIGC